MKCRSAGVVKLSAKMACGVSPLNGCLHCGQIACGQGCLWEEAPGGSPRYELLRAHVSHDHLMRHGRQPGMPCFVSLPAAGKTRALHADPFSTHGVPQQQCVRAVPSHLHQQAGVPGWLVVIEVGHLGLQQGRIGCKQDVGSEWELGRRWARPAADGRLQSCTPSARHTATHALPLQAALRHAGRVAIRTGCPGAAAHKGSARCQGCRSWPCQALQGQHHES